MLEMKEKCMKVDAVQNSFERNIENLNSDIYTLKDKNQALVKENEELREQVIDGKSTKIQQQEQESKMKIEIQNYETKVKGLNNILEQFKDQ